MGTNPYPWHALERVPRDARAVLRMLRVNVQAAIEAPDLSASMAQLLGQPVDLWVDDQQPLGPAPRLEPWDRQAAACLLQNDHTRLLVEVEPALAACIAATLLGRPTPWIDPSQPVPARVQAAVGAFAAAVARRAFAPHQLVLRATNEGACQQFAKPLAPPSEAAEGFFTLAAAITVVLDADAYAARVCVLTRRLPTRRDTTLTRSQLRAMGSVPLRLPIIAAISLADRAALASLCTGDAWMPDEGWLVSTEKGRLSGTVVLCAPGGCLGLRAKLHADGRIVVLDGIMPVEVDVDKNGVALETDEASTIADVVADVPVVVRVEMGAVTLTAREWAELRPGDVLTTGRRVADRVSLRVGGLEVGRGELVDVDGELGVRIHERTHEGGTP